METIKYALRLTNYGAAGVNFIDLTKPRYSRFGHPIHDVPLYPIIADLLMAIQTVMLGNPCEISESFEIVAVREVPGRLIVDPIENLTSATAGGHFALRSTRREMWGLFAGFSGSFAQWTGLNAPRPPILYETTEDALDGVRYANLSGVELVRVKETAASREVIRVCE